VNKEKLANEELAKTFRQNIDEITEKAIAAYGLTYTQSAGAGLDAPLLRWCDFILRYIPPAKRQIFVSNKFPLTLPPEPEMGLHRIEKLLIQGGDVNPYQSKTLTEFDTSSVDRRKRTDGLLADWGIHHLHLPLNPVSLGQAYSDRPRPGWILFLKVYANAVLFIDVRKHDEDNLFVLHELVETYIRNWPDDAERYRLEVLGLDWERSPTDTERKQLRDAGMNVPLEVDGKFYIGPGMGVTSAVTSLNASRLCARIRSYTYFVAKEVTRTSFAQKIISKGVESPEFQLVFLLEGNLGIHEKVSNECWHIPRDRSNDLFSIWHNDFMPSWAGQKVVQYWAESLGLD
jgi:hypothetical protein